MKVLAGDWCMLYGELIDPGGLLFQISAQEPQ